MTKTNWGRKGFISSYKSQVTNHPWATSRQRLGQELKQSPWRNTADWLAPLTATRTTDPGMALPRGSWARPYQSSGKTWVLTYGYFTRSIIAELLLPCNQVDEIPFRMHLPLSHVWDLLNKRYPRQYRLLQRYPHVVNLVLLKQGLLWEDKANITAIAYSIQCYVFLQNWIISYWAT